MVVRPGYKQTDVGVIPKDWKVTSLAELGYFLKGSGVSRAESTSGNLPCIRYGEIYTRHSDVIKAFASWISAEVAIKATRLAKGDILFAGSGETKEEIGKCVAYLGSEEAYAGGDIVILRPKRVCSHFLGYYLNTKEINRQKSSKGQGDAVVHISASALSQISVSLPPTLAEQEAIAEALSDADALIESLEQLLVKKRHIKQGAMQELLTGKKRLPGFEKKKGYKQTEVGLIPEDWKCAAIDSVASKVGSGITPTGGSNRYKDHGRPFVRSQNVGWGRVLGNDLVYIDEDTHMQFKGTEIEYEDVLLNITGASIGRCALADIRLVGGNVNQHVCIIRTKSMAQPKFIASFLLSQMGQAQIDSFQAGGNREGLNFGQIRSMLFPLPHTLEEQDTIAAVLSDMDDEIAALEAKLDKARQIKQGMMQELLTGRIRLV